MIALQIKQYRDVLDKKRETAEEQDRRRLILLQERLAEQAAYDRERYICSIKQFVAVCICLPVPSYLKTNHSKLRSYTCCCFHHSLPLHSSSLGSVF